jgi:hypothetical protein
MNLQLIGLLLVLIVAAAAAAAGSLRSHRRLPRRLAATRAHCFRG